MGTLIEVWAKTDYIIERWYGPFATYDEAYAWMHEHPTVVRPSYVFVERRT